jgi:hypothetical protein
VKKNQLVKAIKSGDVICVSAVGLTVQYLKEGGVERGYLLNSDGGVWRFNSNERGWREVDKIKLSIDSDVN